MKFLLKLQEFKKCLWDGERVFLGHGLPGHTALVEKHLTEVRWSGLNLRTEGSVGLGLPSPSISQKEGICDRSPVSEPGKAVGTPPRAKQLLCKSPGSVARKARSWIWILSLREL